MEPVADAFIKLGDELKSYDGLDSEYTHADINHADEFVSRDPLTEAVKDCWSLLERALHSNNVSVERFHSFRCLGEQTLHYNDQRATNLDGFSSAVKEITRRRLRS